MNKKRSSLHLVWDVSAIIALFTVTLTAAIYYVKDQERDNARYERLNASTNLRFDYLTEQIADVKQTQAQYNQKIDKIYDIVRGK